MTIVEHLQELRSRLFKAVLGLFLGTIIGFIWYQVSFHIGHLHVLSLGELLKRPYCSLPPESRFGGNLTEECRLLATGPFEMFMLRLKVGALAGVVLSSPVWLYQMWAFITPGLVRRERRATFIAVTAAVILFCAGAALAYFVVNYGLAFLLEIGDEAQVAFLTGGEYFSFILALLLVFGVSFELPLFIVMLNIVGVLEYDTLKDKRRIIILCLFIFAAFMTPGGDPASMSAMAIALCIMVEIALQFCRLNDKRRAKQRAEWLDLADDEASGPVRSSGPIQSEPVTGPTGSRPAASTLNRPAPVRTTNQPRPSAPPASSPYGAPQASAQSGQAKPLSEREGSDFDDVL
ncbi:twin-arginine translocase subunit TatC [Corynebacterium sp. TAE3-ERU12]|uniref:twin-arginine translocase subunit TatC n=1 Tax=Corynebacterium sp. TAE3-ERU12 TaxID=2849491 RepID=UPI001C4747E2|nr:twin-arginine translocase subunit TatC [Corynebacterium sp. TAE3-ERU12]MBV7295474.1 twin-arginine translocase subunit TatC [Corynebacterium sp. TAE3-ERU12]